MSKMGLTIMARRYDSNTDKGGQAMSDNCKSWVMNSQRFIPLFSLYLNIFEIFRNEFLIIMPKITNIRLKIIFLILETTFEMALPVIL